MQKSPCTWFVYWKLPIDTDFIHFNCKFHQSGIINARVFYTAVPQEGMLGDLSDDQHPSDYNGQRQRALCTVAHQQISQTNRQRNEDIEKCMLQAEAWWRASIWRSHRKVVIKQCSYHNNIIDIQNRLPYSKVVYPAIIVIFSCLMEVNHGVRTGPDYPFR